MTCSYRLNLIAILAILSYMVGVIAAQHSFQSVPPGSPTTMILNVLVIDQMHRPVTNIKQDDFQLLEDNKPLSISSFSTERGPINYVLALDISKSVKAHFNQLISAAKKIIESNTPMDETFFIVFRGEAEAISPHFTHDKVALMESLNKVSRFVGGKSAILDATYLSIEVIADDKKTSHLPDHHYALILITDGFENDSYYKEKEVLQRLSKENVQVFVIGLTKYLRGDNPRLYEDQGKRAIGLLSRLAQETGGYAFFPETDAELDKAAQDIGSFMGDQYKIGFNLKSGLKPGSYNKITIKLIQRPELDQYKVIAPRGYTIHQQ